MIWVLGIALVVALGAAIHLQTELRDAHEEIMYLLAENADLKKNDIRPALGLLAAFKQPFSLHWGLPDYGDAEPTRGKWSASGAIPGTTRTNFEPLAITHLECHDPIEALEGLKKKLTENKATGRYRW